jgi:hypothetical protein
MRIRRVLQRSKYTRTAGAALIALTLFAVMAYSAPGARHSIGVPLRTPVDVQVVASSNNGNGNSPGSFSAAGRLTGLFPGRQTQLVMSITNPNSFAIDVTSVTVTVGTPTNRTGCGAANVVATNFTGSFIIDKKATTTNSLAIQMLASAPDACQGASFPLTFGGLAVKA